MFMSFIFILIQIVQHHNNKDFEVKNTYKNNKDPLKIKV